MHRLPVPSATPCPATPAPGARTGGSVPRRAQAPGREGACAGSHTPVAEQVAAGPSLPTSSRPAVPTSHHETSGSLGLFTQPSCSWAETQRPSHRWTPAVDLPKSPPATLPRRPAGSFSSAVPRPPSALPPDPLVFTAEFLGPPHLNVRATPGRPHSHLPVSAAGGSLQSQLSPKGRGLQPRARPPSLPPHRVALGSLCSVPIPKVVD